MLEPQIQDNRRWWSREDLLVLLLLAVLLYLPGISHITLFDRDEPRFASAAREMTISQNWIVPHFNGHMRPDKPPMMYWLMSGGYWLTNGPSELGARLPSACCSALTLLVLYFAVGARFGRVTGLIASLMLGSTVLFVVESRMATADATMMLAIATCMACAWQAWDAGSSPPGDARNLPRTDRLSTDTVVLDLVGPLRTTSMPLSLALLFWIALAFGTLAKGVPLFFVIFPMLALSIATGVLPQQLRAWKSHFHLTASRVGIALAIAVVVLLTFALAAANPALGDLRTWAVILGILLLGMALAPGLPLIAFRCVRGGNWRWWRQLRPALGIPLLVILVGWWVVAAGLMTDWKLITDMVGIHFLNRAFGPLLQLLHIHIVDVAAPGGNDPMKSYGKPPGFYLAVVWATFWPWSILLVPALYHAFRRVLRRTALSIDPRPYQFLLAWFIPTWIALELARGKLLHYPLPTYIPLAILCADALVQSWHRMTDVFAARWFSFMRWGVTAIWIGLGIAPLALAVWSHDDGLFWRCVPLAGALCALGVASAISWQRPSWPFVVVLGFGAVLLIADTTVLPEMPSIRLSKNIAGRIAEIRSSEPDYRIGFVGYEEPTLVFYAGGSGGVGGGGVTSVRQPVQSVVMLNISLVASISSAAVLRR